MTVYYVKKVEDCSKCKGAGTVEHPRWHEYWEENIDKPLMTQEQDLAWFRDRGYSLIPGEEILCNECGGQGKIKREVDLEQILPSLLLQILLEEQQRLAAIISIGKSKG